MPSLSFCVCGGCTTAAALAVACMSDAPLLRGSASPALLPWGEWDRPDGLVTLSKLQCTASFSSTGNSISVYRQVSAVKNITYHTTTTARRICLAR